MGGAWQHDLILILSLTGVILDTLGRLYLAYDLLGGKNGPTNFHQKRQLWSNVWNRVRTGAWGAGSD
jgi:hypothetical protein